MIRRAGGDDAKAIVALITRNLDRLLPRSLDEIQAMLDVFWVAEVDGVIRGCVCLEVYSKKIAEIRSLVVDAEFRGKGLGQELVQAAVDEAQRRQIVEVLVVTSSPQFFEKLNFGSCLKEKYALFWNGTKG